MLELGRRPSTMTNDPAASDAATRAEWFQRLKSGQGERVTADHDLLAEVQLDGRTFQEIRTATARFLATCLGQPQAAESEEHLMTAVQSNVDRLANRTPNGIVLPKLEFQDQFNAFHQTVASWFQGLQMDQYILSAFCPITIRLVKGQGEPAAHHRPYSAARIHADIWNGEPNDFVVIFMPVFGDIAHTTVEFFEPTSMRWAMLSPHLLADVPKDFDSAYRHVVGPYTEAADQAAHFSPIPLEMKKGYAYFVDATVPHRSAWRGGAERVTVEFRVRRRTGDEERATAESSCDPTRLAFYLPLGDWYALGSTKKISFHDTYADAKRGVFTKDPYNDATFRIDDV